MSRNSSGTYSLPAGNPVVTGTTITSTWGNTTMSDIANALTDSLSRTGLGGMSAGLPLFDGTSSLPGLAWGTELTSGLYRAGSGDFRWVVSTTELLQLTTNLFRLSGTAPVIRINESDAAADNRLWDVIATGEDLAFRALTDALVATNWLTVTRTAGTVDNITLAATALTINGTPTFSGSSVANPAIVLSSILPMIRWNETDAAADNRVWTVHADAEQFHMAVWTDALSGAQDWVVVNRTATTIDTVNFCPSSGTLQYAGREVGYRFLHQTVQSGSYSIVAADNGTMIAYTGAGGHTYTLTSLTNCVVTIRNAGSGNLTLTASSSISWFNGSGTIATGNRTLAVGGVCTAWTEASGNWAVWGVGLL